MQYGIGFLYDEEYGALVMYDYGEKQWKHCLFDDYDFAVWLAQKLSEDTDVNYFILPDGFLTPQKVEKGNLPVVMEQICLWRQEYEEWKRRVTEKQDDAIKMAGKLRDSAIKTMGELKNMVHNLLLDIDEALRTGMSRRSVTMVVAELEEICEFFPEYKRRLLWWEDGHRG